MYLFFADISCTTQVEHLFRYRMNNSIVYASNYLKQFPAPCVTLIAKFISFVSGGFAAVLIIIAFMDESLLEGHVSLKNSIFVVFSMADLVLHFY